MILDLQSRRVIGWAVRNRLKRDLAIRALRMAIALRPPPRGCLFHSDKGSQYCAHDCQKILREHGFKSSPLASVNIRRPLPGRRACTPRGGPRMSGKGNCYDTAAVETFFKTIKAELIWRHTWETRRKAETALAHWS